eukprot:TRINITY_DN8787_c0_g1_i1.p1 TRINITY_DN8787_c0_g1~~TRINITY_DN8787_c0_g1_i1.p1  ORF type:complete len:575 (+),score=154.06 TRINITY_DN8787_c0_g1_i1:90-1727(+)
MPGREYVSTRRVHASRDDRAGANNSRRVTREVARTPAAAPVRTVKSAAAPVRTSTHASRRPATQQAAMHEDDDSESFRSASESMSTSGEDDQSEGDSFESQEDYSDYDSYEDRRQKPAGRGAARTVAAPRAAPAAQTHRTVAAPSAGTARHSARQLAQTQQRQMDRERAAKQANRASAEKAMERQLERAVERATQKAVDKAVQKAATDAARRAAAETARRATTRVTGKTRRRDEEDDEDAAVAAPRRRRQMEDEDVYQEQVRVIRNYQQQQSATSNTQPRQQNWSEVQQPRDDRRIVRVPKVVYQDVSQPRASAPRASMAPRIEYRVSGQGAFRQQQYRQPYRASRPPPRGPIVDHRTVGVAPGTTPDLGPKWTPALAEREARAAADGRQAVEQKIRKAITQHQGADADSMCTNVLAAVGGVGGLVVGADYDMNPQAREALTKLCKLHCCNAANPAPIVAVLQHMKGRIGATVWVDGKDVSSDTGLAANGGPEDPLLRSVNNAVALAGVPQPKKVAAPKKQGKRKGGVEVMTVDDDDDDDMDDDA